MILRSARAWLRFLFLSILDGLLRLLIRPHRPASGVCIIRLDAIGDFVIWQDAARHCREMFPGQRITLLGNAAWADLAAMLPHWDEVWPVDTRRLTRSPAYRWHTLARMRRAGFAIAFAPVQSRSYFGDEAFVRASGAPVRIGAVGDTANMADWQKRMADRQYTRQIAVPDTAQHELEKNGTLPAVMLGEQGFTYSPGMPSLPLLTKLRNDLGLKRDGYFIVFPGASWTGRQWPKAKFIELTGALCAQTGLQAVFCGSAAERALCADISLHSGGETLNLAGQTRLDEFIEVVRGAAFVVGNDTSVIHVAAACSTPAVSLLGGGHFGRFAPYPESLSGQRPIVVNRPMPCYHCNWKCTQPHEAGQAVPCVRDIAVGDVLGAVATIRAGAAAPVQAA